jgi:cytochrome c-type biogenesis protein
MKVTITPQRLRYASAAGVLAVIAIGGLYFFYELAIGGLAAIGHATLAVTVGFGVLAGMLSFFAPCSLALFPSYMSYYATSSSTSTSIQGSLRLGLLATLGMALAYGLISLSLSGVAAVLPLRVLLQYTVPVLAVVILGLGLVFATGRTTSGHSSHRLAQRVIQRTEHANSPARTVFGFGFAYALGSITCILPIFIIFILYPFLTGSVLTGLVAFGAFILGKGLLMVVATILTGQSKQHLLTDLGSHFDIVRKVGGGLMLFAGWYLFRYGLLLWGVQNALLNTLFFL